MARVRLLAMRFSICASSPLENVLNHLDPAAPVTSSPSGSSSSASASSHPDHELLQVKVAALESELQVKKITEATGTKERQLLVFENEVQRQQVSGRQKCSTC